MPPTAPQCEPGLEAGGPIKGPPRWALRTAWTLSTAIPIAGCLPWLVAAFVLRRRRLLVTGAIYLLWPVACLVTSSVVAGVFFGHALNADVVGSWNPDLLLLLWTVLVTWAMSLVNAQLQWKTLFREGRRRNQQLARIDDDALPVSRPYWICLLLWATLGWVGAHRFYTGRWLSGVIYAVTLGLAGAGWAADVFVLRRLLLTAPRVTGEERQMKLAPWAADWSQRFGWFDFALRLPFFVLAPFMFVELCIYFHHLELLAVLVLVVVVCGLLGDLERVIGRLSLLERIPLTRPAITILRDLHQFYFENRPQCFAYYVFQPLVAPVAVWFSPAIRRELWLYGKFLATVFALILLKQLQSFGTSYSYMTPAEIGEWILFHLLFATLVTFLFLIPVVTTSFTFNLAGKHSRLKLLSVIVLVTSLPIAGLTFYWVNRLKAPTMVSWMMLESRMENPVFQRDLQTESEIFLRHYLDRVPNVDPPQWDVLHSTLTERFQESVGHIVQSDESKAFQVRVVQVENEPPALAIVQQWSLANYEKSQTLFVMRADGEFYSCWQRLPPRAETLFASLNSHDLESFEYRVAQRTIAEDQALYELLIDFLWREAGPLDLGEQPQRLTYQAELSRKLKRELHQSGVRGAQYFRIYGWDSGDEQWLGVRDSQHAWLLAAASGRFVQRWDAPVLADHSADSLWLGQLESFDPTDQTLDFRLKPDRELAKDLIREHSQAFLTEAVRWQGPASTAADSGPQAEQTLSDSYRRFVDGLVPPRQLAGFQVVAFGEQGGRWLGIRYQQTPLFAANPEGSFFARGPGIPRMAQQFFGAAPVKSRLLRR